MNRFGTRHFRLQEGGIRYMNRQPLLWMKMNMWNKLCWCGSKIVWPRRKYCCERHSNLWFYSIRAYWEGFRHGVLRLHNYKCAECGYEAPDKKYDRGDKYFDVDHELAISLGGMCYDIENVRPLCKKCHKIKTAEDMGKLAHKRKSKNIEKLEVFT